MVSTDTGSNYDVTKTSTYFIAYHEEEWIQNQKLSYDYRFSI
jgi:hypothetical protein